MRSLLDISYEYIKKIYIKYYKDIHKNKELAEFLSSLASLAYSNEDYERYKFLSNYIYYFRNIRDLYLILAEILSSLKFLVDSFYLENLLLIMFYLMIMNLYLLCYLILLISGECFLI